MTDAPAHAVYAPSSAHRWAECTASAEAIAVLGEQEEGEEAKAGTQAHDEIDRILGQFNGQIVEPEAIREASERLLDVDHPAAYGIALVLKYVANLPRGRVWIEQRVELTKHIWGRCDIAHWQEEAFTLTIVDYKNGFVDVQAEENEQLQIYGASSIYTHNLPAKWVRLVVVQPNSIVPGPRVKQWITSAEALHVFASRVAAIPNGPKEFRFGTHCRYCPLFGRCEATQDVLTKLATMLANPPDAVPASQVAMFMACRKPLDDWFKALDKDQTKKALAGKVPPGMKVVQTTKHRAWRSEDEARTYIVQALGVEVLSPPTPAQAEKLGIDQEWVAANADKPEGGPALAFESDKRPTFERKSAEQMFAGVTGGSGK